MSITNSNNTKCPTCGEACSGFEIVEEHVSGQTLKKHYIFRCKDCYTFLAYAGHKDESPHKVKKFGE